MFNWSLTSCLAVVWHLSVSQTGVGAAAAQSVEAHMAASERPVPRVPETAHERHAEDRECVIIRTASPGGGDEEERPGTHTQEDSKSLKKSQQSV